MPSFDKSGRLRKRVEFIVLVEKGKKFVLPSFVIVMADTGLFRSRIGITVTRKVGNSVSRNRIKRLVREFFRLNRNLFPPADYNIIARNGAVNLGYNAVSQELANGLCRIGQQVNH